MNSEPGRTTVQHEASTAEAWQQATRRLSRQINLGWWLSCWLPMAAVVGLCGMFALLYARWRAAELTSVVAGSIGGAFAVAAVVAWWRCRRRFETQASSQVRLEEAFGLHARLTAASEGVGPWPERPAASDARWPVAWQWQRPLATVAFIAVMLASAAWVPIAGAVSARRTHTIEKPTDARLVEQWIEELETAELIDERSAEAVAGQIQELTERPSDEWYAHASLEAAGTLKEQTAAAMQELAENVAAAERAAAMLSSLHDALPASLRESLAKNLEGAIQGLELGSLHPAGDLAQLLDQLRPVDLQHLSREELQALAQRLAANRASLRESLAKCQGFNLAACTGLCDADAKPCGECEGCQRGAPCQKPGVGGLTRGRGDAELTFGDTSNLGTTRVERIDQAIDAERAAPDAVLAVVDGEHEVDESVYNGPTAGGDLSADADGGVAAAIEVLLPAEQAAAKRFFE